MWVIAGGCQGVAMVFSVVVGWQIGCSHPHVSIIFCSIDMTTSALKNAFYINALNQEQ